MNKEQFENFINAMMMLDVSVEDTRVNENNLSSQIEAREECKECEKNDG